MKTEMVNALNSSIIGGNLVQMDNKNRYHVTDKNGKRKVLSQDQFKRNLENNYDKIQAGQEFTFKKSMSPMKKTILTLAGIGAAIAAVVYRKDLLKLFNKEKIKETAENIASSPSGQKVKKAIEEYKTNNLRRFSDGYGGEENATAVADSILESVGDYVYFIATNNAKDIESKILEMIK